MKHFDLWQWTDFVRGVAAPAVGADMQAHLAACGSCQRAAELMRTVATTARTEGLFEPPAQAVRITQAMFDCLRPAATSLVREIARLVHDSAREPAFAGLRSQDRLSRRALYETSGYHVDLQLERQPESGMVTLVGQVADRIQPATSTADVPVWLVQQDDVLGITVCNEFGEFQLEYEPKRNLRLFVPLPEAGKRLEIPLSSLTPAGIRRNGRKPATRRRTPRRNKPGVRS
jgi:hypothetical protein